MNRRFIETLEILLKNKGEISYKELSEILFINERTIRYDIDKINDILLENNYLLIEKEGKGKLYFKNLEVLDSIIKFFISKISLSEFKDEIIMFKTLFLGRINLSDLCNELDISRSNVKIIIKNIREELEKNSLKLEIETHKGLILVGKEEDIRKEQLKFLNRYAPLDSNLNCKKNYIGELIEKYYENIDLEIVKKFLDNLILESGKILSDEPYNFLKNYIYILLDRVKKNIFLNQLNNENFFMSIKEFQYIDKHIYLLEEKLLLKIPEIEKIKLADYFLGSHSYSLENSFFNFWIEIDIIAKKIIKEFSKNIGANLSRDKDLLDGIINHLKPTIHRLKNNISLDNSILKEFLQLYEPIFQATENSLAHLEEFIGIPISKDEIAFLAIHFKGALDRNLKMNKLKKDILVVCGSGYGTSKLVAQQIKESFDVGIKGIIPFHRLKSFNLNDIDFIVTTLDIKNEDVDKPVIYINTFLIDEDLKKLESMGLIKKQTKIYLTDLLDVYRKNGIISNERELVSDLKNILGDSLIDNLPIMSLTLSELLRDNISLKASKCSWKEAIYFSGDLLLKDKACTLDYIKDMIEKIKEFGPYMVTDGKLAIPHSRNKNSVLKSSIALVTFQEDIIFPNNTPVRTILVFSSKDGNEHLEGISNFMDLCTNHRFLKKLEGDISIKKVKDTIRKYEFLSSLGRHKY